MEKNFYELTAPQKSIWLTEQYYKNTNINNICGTFYSDDILDFEILKMALNVFIQNNDSFRIKLHFTEDKVVQYFSKIEDINFKVINIKNKEEQSTLEAQIASKVFNILDSLLFEIVLYKYPDNHGGFIINSHHIISDSWTNGIVANEVALIYSKIKNNEPYEKDKSLSYIEYINSENKYIESNKFKKDKEYWNNVFNAIPEVATIPSIKENVKDDELSANRTLLDIDTKILTKIKEYCSENKVSLYNFFMAVFSLYLGRVSNLDEFVIGTPILNRTNYKEKETTGMFINILPLKIKLSHEKTFLDNLKDIAINSMSLLRHQKYSYQYLIEDLRKKDLNLPKLYNVMYSYQITKMNENMDSLKHVTSWVFNKTISDDLDIHMFEWNENDFIKIAYDYRISKYDEQDILDLHARILHVINQILDKKDILLRDIEIVTPEEKNKILFEFNDTKTDYPKDKTIVDLFEEQVEKTPDNTAIVFEGQKLTYRELNEKANQLARYLIEKGVVENNIVAILLNRSLDMMVAILAILKSGAAYLPIDPTYPTDRINFILKNSKCSFILTSKSISFIDNKNLYIEDIYELTNKYNKKNLCLKISPSNIAYIIYTSGSTGLPKGVVLKHLSLSNLIFYCNNYISYLKDNVYRSIVSVTTISFDIFIFETLISLQKGLKLVIANSDEQVLPTSLDKLIENEKIEIIQTTPSRMQIFYNNKDLVPSLSKLKYFVLAGEPLPKVLVDNLHSLNNTSLIYNGYGPSETTVFETITDVSEANKITIGKPLANTHIYILDTNRNLCPLNTPGEIYIAGDSVGYGYLNDKKLTEKSFLKDTFYDNLTMYKSGDLGYYTRSGEIVCLGRIDNQVKIRGLRIELDEIEKNLLKMPNINNCCVVKQNISHHDFLCAYFVTNFDIDINAIRKFLSNLLPNYMVPSYFIRLNSLPYTPNGKIDKKSLPKPEIDNKASTLIQNPRNPTDKKLINMLEDYFKVDNITLNDSFYELGGDSLSAIDISTLIYKNFGISISIKSIYDNPLVMQLSDYISSTLSSNSIYKVKKSSYYTISSAQKRIYYSWLRDKESLLYNISGGIIIDGNIEIEKLENCFKILIERHSSLRTYFEQKGDDIVQIVKDKIDFKLKQEKEDIDDIDKIYRKFVKPFNLSKAPLFRVKLSKLKNERLMLLLDMHHIISDGTSLNILLKELCDLYNGDKLSDKNLEYKDFTIWEQSQKDTEDFKKQKEYWIDQFKDEIPLLNMPTTYSRPSTQCFNGSNYHSKLSKKQFNKISLVAQKLGITPYMLMLSTYYILLSKYTSQDDIVVGTPVIGRDMPELTNMLGMFVNTLALRNKVDHGTSFKEFSEQVKLNCLSSFKNQTYPFDMLVDDLKVKRDAGRNPLFDVMFVFQNNGYPHINLNNVKSEYYIPDNNISKFDLTLEVIPINNEYALRFEYCTKLYEEDFIKRFSTHYINILNSILENEEIKIADIDMLSEEEKNKILYEFNNTKVEYPKEKTIVELFEEQVKKTPNNIAIVFEDQKLTYRELNEKANQLARFLLNNGAEPNSIIGVMLPRSVDTIVSMLAIIKLNCAYFLIDIALPEDRVLYMLDKSNTTLLITNNQTPYIDYNNKINISKEYYSYSTDDISFNILSTSPFSVIFTSGSTGKPKGIILTHQGVNNMFHNYIEVLKIDSCSNFISISSVAFDMFMVEVFITLLSGKKLVLSNEEQQKIPILIYKLIKEHNVNFLLTTPSRINLMLFQDLMKDLVSLKIIQLGGEALTSELYKKLRNNTNAHIFNGYGPSEITACCSSKEITNSSITIGKPFNNFNIFVLDKDLNICPIGVPGELCVSGDGLAIGYINNEQMTQKSFINSFKYGDRIYRTGDLGLLNKNNELEYIGRIDNQIKIRGLRVELSEIEKQLLKIDSISECAVIYKPEEEYISAFIVSTEMKPDYSVIREKLKKVLPMYMVPKYITKIDKMPITNNGKIDKKLLLSYHEDKNIQTHSDSILEHITPEEELFCNVWKELLNNDISVNDNVFDIGADSLLAIKFKTRMLAYGIDIAYSDIFKYPTIRKLCNNVNHNKQKNDDNNDEYDYLNINRLLEENNIKNISETKFSNNNNILLLGSNGFVGMHILYNYIKNDKGIAYCLVRGKQGISAYNRFMKALHFYFGDELDIFINNRIFIITGNILRKNFGLLDKDLKTLADKVDVVINAAAIVKHYGNAKEFNDINVGTTEVALDFCKASNKRFIHISSLSVSGNASLEPELSENNFTSDISFSEQNLFIGQPLNNVYINSKFMAERLILENIVNNQVSAQIIRLGNITNRMSDGKFQINPNDNAFYNRIKTILDLKYIPDNLLSSYIEFTPVDICAFAIIVLMQNYNSKFSVFHVYNDNHIYIDDFVKYLESNKTKINVVSEKQFSSIIKKELSKKQNNLDGIINDLDNNNHISYDSNVQITSEFTKAFLYHLNFKWPLISKEYLNKFLRDLTKGGVENV